MRFGPEASSCVSGLSLLWKFTTGFRDEFTNVNAARDHITSLEAKESTTANLTLFLLIRLQKQ